MRLKLGRHLATQAADSTPVAEHRTEQQQVLKSGKQTKRKLELVEEVKEGPDFRSSIRTRSALKAKRNEADSVTDQIAGAKLGGGDVLMDDF